MILTIIQKQTEFSKFCPDKLEEAIRSTPAIGASEFYSSLIIKNTQNVLSLHRVAHE